MVTPLLVQLSLPSIASRSSDRSRFQVLRAGRIGDMAFAAGDVIVCGGEPLDGQLTVLVARGPLSGLRFAGALGRPRFGRVRGIRLFGEVEEPCDAARWHPAGRILAHTTWSSAERASGPWPPSRGTATPAVEQLELFAA
jgi:hypothetical protein